MRESLVRACSVENIQLIRAPLCFGGANAMSIRAAIPASKRSRTVMIGESPVAFAMRLVENFSLGGRHGDGFGQCSAIETHAFARCSLHSLVTIYPRNASLKRQTEDATDAVLPAERPATGMRVGSQLPP